MLRQIPITKEMTNLSDQQAFQELVEVLQRNVQIVTATPTVNTAAKNGTIFLKIDKTTPTNALTIYVKNNDTIYGG